MLPESLKWLACSNTEQKANLYLERSVFREAVSTSKRYMEAKIFGGEAFDNGGSHSVRALPDDIADRSRHLAG